MSKTTLAQANVDLCDPPLPAGQVAEMAGYAGGYDVAGFVMIPRQMLLSHAFAALSYSAVALLLDIAARYTGTNNGRITVPFVAMQERGWKSPVTLNKVLRELRASGFLKLTKKGGSHRPSWYALPWVNHTTTTTTAGDFFWQPDDDTADAVQIEHMVTKRMQGESLQEMLDRAIRDYPDKLAKLVVVGRHA
jgi:hypothetical protein